MSQGLGRIANLPTFGRIGQEGLQCLGTVAANVSTPHACSPSWFESLLSTSSDHVQTAPPHHGPLPCLSPLPRPVPDGRLALHRVNGENALAPPPARSRPTSPRHPQRPRSDARSRPVEQPGLGSSPLHPYALKCEPLRSMIDGTVGGGWTPRGYCVTICVTIRSR